MNRRMLPACGWLLLAAAVLAADRPAAVRPETWARPIELEGVPNLHRVSDDLYRSAQPTAEGMRNLEKLGIRTIVNLRSFHSDRDELRGTDLAYERLYVKAWHPEWKEAVRFLQIATDSRRTPVLVHCKHGADRTGAMCALYRIAVQGWTREEAVREMTEGGFGFHEIWDNLPEWVRGMDIEKLRSAAGIAADSPKKKAPNPANADRPTLSPVPETNAGVVAGSPGEGA